MAVDGVTAEVLYPTLGLRLYAMEDAEAQEACFRIANDWLIEYCRVAPDRLVGIPMISMFNLDNAIKELERCKKEGMKGCLIWQVPPEDRSFATDYYEPFWEAAQDMDMPVNLHILTGFNYSRFLGTRKGIEAFLPGTPMDRSPVAMIPRHASMKWPWMASPPRSSIPP